MKVEKNNLSHKEIKTKNNNQKSWRKLDGSMKADIHLKKICQKWSALEWEQYLEEIEVSLKESQISTYEFDAIAEGNNISEEFKKMPSHVECSYARNIILKAVNQLSKRQKVIIKLLFWENLSQAEVARRLKINRSAVHSSKEKAIEKLREKFGPNMWELLVISGFERSV